MKIVERLAIPRRLSARMWLVTLPSAVLSFERRSRIPKLPIGTLRLLGIPLVIGGAGFVVWASRRPNVAIAYNGPLAGLRRSPATVGAVVALAGVALVMRSAPLFAYAVGMAVAAGTETFEVEEPRASVLMGD